MKATYCGLYLSALMLGASTVAGQAVQLPEWSRDWRNYFRTGFSAVLVQGLPAGVEVVEVRGMNGRALGWLFRTDQIEPYVKGYKDQIAVKVALSREKKILGVAVVAQQETPKYFQKIGESFFAQFRNRSVDAPPDEIHTVTGATVSSRAIIRDVLESARELLKLEPVKRSVSNPETEQPAVPQDRETVGQDK